MQNFRALGALPPDPRASGGCGALPPDPYWPLVAGGLHPHTPIGLWGLRPHIPETAPQLQISGYAPVCTYRSSPIYNSCSTGT